MIDESIMTTLRRIPRILILLVFVTACAGPEEKAAEFVRSAGTLLDEGNLVKAEIEYKNALQINQNLPDAWFGLARIYEQQQRWRDAYGALNRIRELSPNHVDSRIMLGQILLASNQLDQALADAREISELAPDDARAHALMAAEQYRLENFAGARTEVRRALDLDPGNNEAMLVLARVLIAEDKHNKAIEILQKATEKYPDNVSFYLMQVQSHLETGNREAIEDIYLALVERFPQNAVFKLALVNLYLEDEDIDRAEQLLEEVVRADPDDVNEKIRLVGFKNRFRSFDDAVALAKSYIAKDKDEHRFRFLLAELYEGNGERDQAIAVYENIVADDGLQPNGLEARGKIALLELRAGNRERAIRLVDEILEQDKANENALLLRAGFQMSDGNFDDAVVSLRTVLRDNPESVKALGLLGQAYEAQGSGELALESYGKAYQLSPGTPLIANRFAQNLIRQRKYDKASELLHQSIARGNRSVDGLKLLTQARLALGDWGDAERLARQLQAIEGQEAASQQVLGIVYQGREDRAASVAAFERAHELSPDSTQPVVALVRTYLQGGQIDKARLFLDSVVAVHPENPTAYLLLGQLSLMQNDVSSAIDHFNRVIEVNPKVEAGYRGLASIYLRQNEHQKAEDIIRQGLSVMPGLPVLSIHLASIYERQRKLDEAIRIYEELLDENDKMIIARNNLASLLTDHRGDPASRERARALSADFRTSKIPQFRDTYAWAAVKSGINLEEAVVILEAIVRENDTVADYNYHLGEAYRKKGARDDAIVYLNRAIDHSTPGSDIPLMARHALQLLD